MNEPRLCLDTFSHWHKHAIMTWWANTWRNLAYAWIRTRNYVSVQFVLVQHLLKAFVTYLMLALHSMFMSCCFDWLSSIQNLCKSPCLWGKQTVQSEGGLKRANICNEFYNVNCWDRKNASLFDRSFLYCCLCTMLLLEKSRVFFKQINGNKL